MPRKPANPARCCVWESPTHFVVVGYANKVASEVNVAACEAGNPHPTPLSVAEQWCKAWAA